jgi:hypothetical protein
MNPDLLTGDLDGQTALALADLLYRLADEIMNRNDGAIRIHLAQLDDLRRERDHRQIPLPGLAPFDDLPF